MKHPRWNIELMHEDCKDCEELIEHAVRAAERDNAHQSTSSFVDTKNLDAIRHQVRVVRK